MKKIVILGGSGMLGAMAVEYFSRQPDCQVMATVRDRDYLERAATAMPEVAWVVAGSDHEKRSFGFDSVSDVDWIINAVGIIKPLIKDDDAAQVERAIWVNSMFPNMVAELAQNEGARVLQIATDCVYSGVKGRYTESDFHDALDVYGKTKSLGECRRPQVAHLRCSIIGPEIKDHRSLLDWFLMQPPDARVKGFSNHDWNGVTTLHFAKLCHGIIRDDIEIPHLQHVIPTGSITKAAMLQAFAGNFNRPDIAIEVVEAPVKIDRTLATNHHDLNRVIWEAAGYEQPPTVEEMITELSEFELRMRQE